MVSMAVEQGPSAALTYEAQRDRRIAEILTTVTNAANRGYVPGSTPNDALDANEAHPEPLAPEAPLYRAIQNLIERGGFSQVDSSTDDRTLLGLNENLTTISNFLHQLHIDRLSGSRELIERSILDELAALNAGLSKVIDTLERSTQPDTAIPSIAELNLSMPLVPDPEPPSVAASGLTDKLAALAAGDETSLEGISAKDLKKMRLGPDKFTNRAVIEILAQNDTPVEKTLAAEQISVLVGTNGTYISAENYVLLLAREEGVVLETKLWTPVTSPPLTDPGHPAPGQADLVYTVGPQNRLVPLPLGYEIISSSAVPLERSVFGTVRVPDDVPLVEGQKISLRIAKPAAPLELPREIFDLMSRGMPKLQTPVDPLTQSVLATTGDLGTKVDDISHALKLSALAYTTSPIYRHILDGAGPNLAAFLSGSRTGSCGILDVLLVDRLQQGDVIALLAEGPFVPGNQKNFCSHPHHAVVVTFTPTMKVLDPTTWVDITQGVVAEQIPIALRERLSRLSEVTKEEAMALGKEFAAVAIGPARHPGVGHQIDDELPKKPSVQLKELATVAAFEAALEECLEEMKTSRKGEALAKLISDHPKIFTSSPANTYPPNEKILQNGKEFRRIVDAYVQDPSFDPDSRVHVAQVAVDTATRRCRTSELGPYLGILDRLGKDRTLPLAEGGPIVATVIGIASNLRLERSTNEIFEPLARCCLQIIDRSPPPPVTEKAVEQLKAVATLAFGAANLEGDAATLKRQCAAVRKKIVDGSSLNPHDAAVAIADLTSTGFKPESIRDFLGVDYTVPAQREALASAAARALERLSTPGYVQKAWGCLDGAMKLAEGTIALSPHRAEITASVETNWPSIQQNLIIGSPNVENPVSAFIFKNHRRVNSLGEQFLGALQECGGVDLAALEQKWSQSNEQNLVNAITRPGSVAIYKDSVQITLGRAYVSLTEGLADLAHAGIEVIPDGDHRLFHAASELAGVEYKDTSGLSALFSSPTLREDLRGAITWPDYATPQGLAVRAVVDHAKEQIAGFERKAVLGQMAVAETAVRLEWDGGTGPNKQHFSEAAKLVVLEMKQPSGMMKSSLLDLAALAGVPRAQRPLFLLCAAALPPDGDSHGFKSSVAPVLEHPRNVYERRPAQTAQDEAWKRILMYERVVHTTNSVRHDAVQAMATETMRMIPAQNRHSLGALLGDVQSGSQRTSVQTERFLGHRDYLPGEDRKAIDQRALGKTDKYLVKIFGAAPPHQEFDSVRIFVDGRCLISKPDRPHANIGRIYQTVCAAAAANKRVDLTIYFERAEVLSFRPTEIAADFSLTDRADALPGSKLMKALWHTGYDIGRAFLRTPVEGFEVAPLFRSLPPAFGKGSLEVLVADASCIAATFQAFGLTQGPGVKSLPGLTNPKMADLLRW